MEAKLIVIFGSRTYGDPGTTTFGTDKERDFIMDRKIPYFLIKMCDRFEDLETFFSIPRRFRYEFWKPGDPLSDRLVNKVIERFDNIVAERIVVTMENTTAGSSVSGW